MEDQEQGGRLFRNAWIEGVQRNYPGTPKESYIAPWPQMPKWEQESACAVYEQVRQFVVLAGGQTIHLSREQKGRFVSLCWIGQIFKHIPNPKPSYVADWQDLPEWQRETDAHIFETIEEAVREKSS
jgi:hypothetical protein